MHPIAARQPDRDFWNVLAERRSVGSRPGSRGDPWRVGLVIEGGAMRGVVSAAMAAALGRLGLGDAFDYVVGVSAGSITGAYFIAGQWDDCVPSYYEEMTTREFIDFRRLFARKPPVSLSFVLDEVAEHRRGLVWQAVLNSSIDLAVVATDVETAEAVTFSDFATKDDLKDALRASSCIPLFAGSPIAIDSRRYLDGSIAQAIPVAAAVKAGCTHVLVLRTRPDGAVPGPPGWVDRWIVAPRLAKLSRRLAAAFLLRDEYKRVSAALDLPVPERVTWFKAHVESLRLPQRTPHLQRRERRQKLMREAADVALAYGLETIEAELRAADVGLATTQKA